MEALMVIFIYLDKSYGKTIIIDPMIPKVITQTKIKTNWLKNIYGEDNQEKILANTPEPLGKPIQVNVFVDASHAEENLTYHSHTGILVFVNNTPIIWFSKTNTWLKLIHLVMN